jgi:hypothetical protein
MRYDMLKKNALTTNQGTIAWMSIGIGESSITSQAKNRNTFRGFYD